eukprot:SAG31_NODE_39556_length_287_cov_0.829787_1_plen_71_part_10
MSVARPPRAPRGIPDNSIRGRVRYLKIRARTMHIHILVWNMRDSRGSAPRSARGRDFKNVKFGILLHLFTR